MFCNILEIPILIKLNIKKIEFPLPLRSPLLFAELLKVKGTQKVFPIGQLRVM